jgi:hypothetical protein
MIYEDDETVASYRINALIQYLIDEDKINKEIV